MNKEFYDENTGMILQPGIAATTIARQRYRKDFGHNAICTFCQGNLTPRILKLGDEERRFGFNDCECEEYKKAHEQLFKEATEEFERWEIAENKRILSEYVWRSGLGPRFAERTFDNYIAETEWQKSAISITKEFCQNMIEKKNKGQGLLLSGSVGTGKTHLAAAAAMQLMGQGIETKYGTATQILSDIKAGWSNDDNRIISKLSYVPLLVVDDLGKEYSKKVDGWSWAQEQFFQVINNRYERYLPMIITTNHDMQQLSKVMGDAIVSRLVECCKGVRCTGDDYRMNWWDKK